MQEGRRWYLKRFARESGIGEEKEMVSMKFGFGVSDIFYKMQLCHGI